MSRPGAMEDPAVEEISRLILSFSVEADVRAEHGVLVLGANVCIQPRV